MPFHAARMADFLPSHGSYHRNSVANTRSDFCFHILITVVDTKLDKPFTDDGHLGRSAQEPRSPEKRKLKTHGFTSQAGSCTARKYSNATDCERLRCGRSLDLRQRPRNELGARSSHRGDH